MPEKYNVSSRIMEDPALRDSFDKFKREFPDVVENQALFALADSLTIELQAEHPEWCMWNIMEAAGLQARVRFTGSKRMQDATQMRMDKLNECAERQSRTEQELKWKQRQFEVEREHRRRQRFNMPPVGSSNKEQRILSRPVPVHWAGWETDTTRLQRNGWQLAVEFEPMKDMYALMMRHPEMNMTALTSAIRLDHGLSLMDNYSRRGFADPSPGVNAMVPFNVIKVAPQFENVRIQSTASWENFQLIDAEPQMVETTIERPEDLNIFALAMSQAEQVAIDKADMSVVEHLEAIKDLQSDEQKTLREKARKREARREGEHAVTGEVVVQLVDYKH
jgi:hypothetical protein